MFSKPVVDERDQIFGSYGFGDIRNRLITETDFKIEFISRISNIPKRIYFCNFLKSFLLTCAE